jgi:hypothetical protein
VNALWVRRIGVTLPQIDSSDEMVDVIEACEAGDDQINGNDVIEKARNDEDQNAGNQSDDWRNMGGGEVHFGLRLGGNSNGERA